MQSTAVNFMNKIKTIIEFISRTILYKLSLVKKSQVEELIAHYQKEVLRIHSDLLYFKKKGDEYRESIDSLENKNIDLLGEIKTLKQECGLKECMSMSSGYAIGSKITLQQYIKEQEEFLKTLKEK